MSSFQKDKERQIRIFKNKFKEKDTQPDYRGLFTIDGKEYIATIYVRKSKDGVPYLGGKIYDKTESGSNADKQDFEKEMNDLANYNSIDISNDLPF